MIRECSFILPSGRKCRCAATRHLSVCRHHAPKPAVPGPPPTPKRDRYSELSRWRAVGATLQWMPADQIPENIYQILQCLIDRGEDSTGHISDRVAGRYLRILLNRLGDVPFPDPDLALLNPAGNYQLPAVPASPQPSRPAAHPEQVPSMSELSAMLTSLGVPAPHGLQQRSQPPMSQSHPRVNQ